MKAEREIRRLYDKGAASERYALYKAASEQLERALKEGFYIEAVAICESMISDRLHARYSHLKNHNIEARRERDFGKLINILKNSDEKKYNGLHEIYELLHQWKEKRNNAVHGAVKLREGQSALTFHERYEEVGRAAIEGKKLFNQLKCEMARIKKPKKIKV